MEGQVPVRFTLLSSSAFLMAAIAGFTDVFAFVSLDGLFTAHITGNIVIAIAELIRHAPGVATKIISIPLFIVISMVVTTCIEGRGQTKGLLAMYFGIEAILFAGFLFTGMFVVPHASVSSWPYLCSAMLPVVAMAIHNTLLRTYMSQFPPCTVMTGNLTQLTIDAVSYAWGWRERYSVEKRGKSQESFQVHGNVFAGFLVGGAVAAVGYVLFSFWTVAIPVILLVVMAVRAERLLE